MERMVKFRSEHPCKKINIAGVQWEYIACGVGTRTLLLLTGAMRLAETAFYWIQMFEDSYRLIAPTYPPLWTMDEITDGIMNILDAEKVQTAYALGQSYGGWMAQVLVRRYPSRFRKLVLSSSGPLTATKTERVLLGPIITLLQVIPEGLLKWMLRRAVLSDLPATGSERDFLRAYTEEILTRLGKPDLLSHFRAARDAVNKKYTFAEGEKSDWDGELLMIGGKDDRFVSEEDRKRILEIYPQAQFHVFARGGHDVFLVEQSEYRTAVKEFLDK